MKRYCSYEEWIWYLNAHCTCNCTGEYVWGNNWIYEQVAFRLYALQTVATRRWAIDPLGCGWTKCKMACNINCRNFLDKWAGAQRDLFRLSLPFEQGISVEIRANLDQSTTNFQTLNINYCDCTPGIKPAFSEQKTANPISYCTRIFFDE